MTLNHNHSEKLFSEAKTFFPGGVNSPVRAFRAVGGSPVFVKKATGAYLWDEDGNRYIDCIGSWGPAIIGHAHPEVVEAVKTALDSGFSFGAPSALENKLARKVQSLVPSMEMMRFCSSGTEACMGALRLARGFTGRDKILKFDGCYHGHADMLLVQAGSGVATLGIPGSPGVPEGATKDTLVAPYNDLAAVESIFKEHGKDIAAVIIEPIVGNANFIRPAAGFLEGLRELTNDYGALFIFDEVMTGFRVSLGGVQGLYNIKPDLTCLGKVIGGGMPIGAFGGRADIMAHLAPAGPVYQAGTLSGNPIAVTCGLKTLELLSEKYSFTQLEERTKRLSEGMVAAASDHGIDLAADCQGGMFGFVFRNRMVTNFKDAQSADTQTFNRFFHEMLERGVYLAPSAYEAGFISTVHTEADIDQIIDASRDSFAALTEGS